MVVDLSVSANMEFRPSLFDIHKILDEVVVGEYESRMSVFTNWILGGSNVMMSGPRSSGKTWVSDHVINLVGDTEEEEKGRCFTLAAGSEKSAWYQMDTINKADYIRILELNKIPKEALELLKDWGEGKESKYNTVVFEGGVRKNKKIKIPPKPFLFCLADEDETKVGVQLMSRLTMVRTDATINQNKAVLAQQAKLAKEPTNIKEIDVEFVNKIKHHIHSLPPLSKFDFKHPASEMFVNAIPSFFTDCRRDFPKYMKNVNGICRFHWKERISDGEFMFITPQDMYINHIVYGNILVESALKCSNIEREIIHVLQTGVEAMNRTDIQIELRKRGINVSKSMTTRHINSLVDVGYLNRIEKSGTKVAHYDAGDFFKEFSFTFNWNDIIQESMDTITKFYPNVADSYRKLFVDKAVAQHPFTGELIDLKTLKAEVIEPSKDSLNHYTKSDESEVLKYCKKHDKEFDVADGCPECLGEYVPEEQI